MQTTTKPDIYADFDSALIVESPDGKYDVVRFHRGQVIDGVNYWWGVGRHGDKDIEVFTTSLNDALAWLAERLLITCF